MLPPRAVECPGVDCLTALVDAWFPDTQPRIVAHGITEGAKVWPHVEGDGLLCLKSTRRGADAGERIVRHLDWALELLKFSADQRRREFQREFGSYWGRCCDKRSARTVYSLVNPQGPSREINYGSAASAAELLFADDRQQLVAWLRNAGHNPSVHDIHRTWLAWLDEPWTPDAFPSVGADILAHVPASVLETVVRARVRLPVLIGVQTDTGPVLGCVVLETASKNQLTRGFRPSKVPARRVIDSMSLRPVKRHEVRRVDGAYVHGRGDDPSYAMLASKTVAVVGCGALGGFVTRLLAQAGVGNFILVDPDALRPENTSRHVLGQRYVGQLKADALGRMLREDFPHVGQITPYRGRIERLSGQPLERLVAADLIVSAGIDFVGDAALNRSRRRVVGAPPHVCAWIEAYALAGHALAVFGDDDLMLAFDDDGNPVRELTTWDSAQILEQEAGCGNVFQTYGAVDLQRTVALAGRLALDVLQGRRATSVWRSWQGDRDEVLRLGGKLSAEFKGSNVEREHRWTSTMSAEE